MGTPRIQQRGTDLASRLKKAGGVQESGRPKVARFSSPAAGVTIPTPTFADVDSQLWRKEGAGSLGDPHVRAEQHISDVSISLKPRGTKGSCCFLYWIARTGVCLAYSMEWQHSVASLMAGTGRGYVTGSELIQYAQRITIPPGGHAFQGDDN